MTAHMQLLPSVLNLSVLLPMCIPFIAVELSSDREIYFCVLKQPPIFTVYFTSTTGRCPSQLQLDCPLSSTSNCISLHYSGVTVMGTLFWWNFLPILIRTFNIFIPCILLHHQNIKYKARHLLHKHKISD